MSVACGAPRKGTQTKDLGGVALDPAHPAWPAAGGVATCSAEIEKRSQSGARLGLGRR